MLAPEQNTRSRALMMTTVAHLGALEADAVDGVVELDIDAEVIGIELELVAGPQARVLVEVGKQRRDRPVELELPVFVARRLGLIVDPVHGAPVHRQFSATYAS